MANVDIEKTIKEHNDVKNFVMKYHNSFADFDQILHSRLLDNMLSLNISNEEINITNEIFQRLESLPIVDRYQAYQIFADNWGTIAQDLEIIQSEGFKATRIVNPNMIIRKSGNDDTEVQNGWVGHILPFELVQITHLTPQNDELTNLRTRAEIIESNIDETLNSLDDDEKETLLEDDKLKFKYLEVAYKQVIEQVETPEITALQEYLSLSKKSDKQLFINAHDEIEWSAMSCSKDGTYPAKSVNAYITKLRGKYIFEDMSYEQKIALLYDLNIEIKQSLSCITFFQQQR